MTYKAYRSKAIDEAMIIFDREFNSIAAPVAARTRDLNELMGIARMGDWGKRLVGRRLFLSRGPVKMDGVISLMVMNEELWCEVERLSIEDEARIIRMMSVPWNETVSFLFGRVSREQLRISKTPVRTK
jgi:hypothetical protein